MNLSIKRFLFLSLIFLIISNHANALTKKEFIMWGERSFGIFWDVDKNKKNRKKLDAWINIPMDCVLGLPSASSIQTVGLKDFDAMNLGLRVGDVIEKINGETFYDDAYLQKKLDVGDEVIIRVQRGKNNYTDVVTKCNLSRKSYADFMVSLGRSIKSDNPSECISSVKNAFQNRSQLLYVRNLYPQCVFRSLEK